MVVGQAPGEATGPRPVRLTIASISCLMTYRVLWRVPILNHPRFYRAPIHFSPIVALTDLAVVFCWRKARTVFVLNMLLPLPLFMSRVRTADNVYIALASFSLFSSHNLHKFQLISFILPRTFLTLRGSRNAREAHLAMFAPSLH